MIEKVKRMTREDVENYPRLDLTIPLINEIELSQAETAQLRTKIAELEAEKVELERELGPLEDREFSKAHWEYNGEELNTVKQLKYEAFTGEELLEFCNYIRTVPKATGKAKRDDNGK